jgi:hypothetical protein
MTAVAPDQILITLPARSVALAWLNAFAAAGGDSDRPLLCRTLSLEFFAGQGLQLIGCDGTALFRTWVPVQREEAKAAAWPDYAEVPTRSVVVIDGDGFGLAFMRTLLAATNDEEHEHEELAITTAPADEGATLSLGDEFMTERVILRACGQRIDLRLFESPYPDWRRLRLGLDAIERMESMTIAPRLLALVGKLKGAHAVDLEFYGDRKHIAFVVRGVCEVRGLVMPMRRPENPIEDVPAHSPPPPPTADDDVTLSTQGKHATRRGRGSRSGR